MALFGMMGRSYIHGQAAEEHIHHWWEYCSELLCPRP